MTAVHSVAGTLAAGARGWSRRPPFEDPHHTATRGRRSSAAGVGLPRPGAASRAHRGVLFLDEAPEFAARRSTRCASRSSTGELVIHRAPARRAFPARFQLVLAANPCPCGAGDRHGRGLHVHAAGPSPLPARLSGPLLDRVDIQVEVAAGLPRADGGDARAAGDRRRWSRPAGGRGAGGAAGAAGPARAVVNGEVPGPDLRGPLRLATRGHARTSTAPWTAAC